LPFGSQGYGGPPTDVNLEPASVDLAIMVGFALVMLFLGAYFFEKSESV
jgi:hypothetical protein